MVSYLLEPAFTTGSAQRISWDSCVQRRYWSPQHRAHWIAEQMLDWSGVPTVNVRAAIFVENPILTWLPLGPLSKGELRLPFGLQRLSPIAGYDVAELCVRILVDPAPHIWQSYELTGPELKDMHGFAQDYAAALGRPVSYIPEEVEAWNETFVDPALAEHPHTAEHLKALTRLVAGGGYRGVTDQLGTLLGRPPKTVRWALENHPRIRKLAAA
jgi:uncharacterized protein YbjT (DUF2867 family)